ncbi:MAG TPA: hypothetical protein VHE33_21405 [Acidobacteriaceae bacterium]|nr:hypothetical protein [Acidobacteriaceae bacterium]
METVKQVELWPGLWPGVAAIVGDAELLCIACAEYRFGVASVRRVIDGGAEQGEQTDQWGHTLGVVLCGSKDLHGTYCGRCQRPLCDEDCICYQPGQADHWNQYGTFL